MEFAYTVERMEYKTPLLAGRSVAAPSTCFLGPVDAPEYTTQPRHLDRFNRFARLTAVTNKQTDRRTDARVTVAMVRSYHERRDAD